MRVRFHPVALALFLGSTAIAPLAHAEAAPPTDAQIMAIAGAANHGEIEAAKLASTRAKDKAVKEFAKNMVSDHGGVIKKSEALAKKLGVKPEPSADSQALEAENKKAADMLKPLKNTAFDKQYIDQQVNAHQEVLSALDKTLIPNAQNPELKALLQEVRPTVAAHLDHARKIQANLSGKA